MNTLSFYFDFFIPSFRIEQEAREAKEAKEAEEAAAITAPDGSKYEGVSEEEGQPKVEEEKTEVSVPLTEGDQEKVVSECGVCLCLLTCFSRASSGQSKHIFVRKKISPMASVALFVFRSVA